MNEVYVDIRRVGHIGHESEFRAVVWDHRTDDIEVRLLAAPGLLDQGGHKVAKAVAEWDPEAREVIETALREGAPVYVNRMPAVDQDAYEALEDPEKSLRLGLR